MTKCPKGPHNAFRVYAQVTSPKSKGGTGKSTTVNLPFVFCGTLRTRVVPIANGKTRVVGELGPKEDGQHGLVPVDPSLFATRLRESRARTARAHPEWAAGKPEEPKKPRGSGGPSSPSQRGRSPSRKRSKKPRGAEKGPRSPSDPSEGSTGPRGPSLEGGEPAPRLA